MTDWLLVGSALLILLAFANWLTMRPFGLRAGIPTNGITVSEQASLHLEEDLELTWPVAS